MTRSTQPHPARRALLAQVHLAKKELGLDEDTYRDMLAAVAGKRSASELTIPELERVVAGCRARGWQSGAAAPTTHSPRGRFAASQKPHVRKVWATWGGMGRDGLISKASRQALRTFVERMTKCSDPEWLTPEQANVVIEGLKAWRGRLEAARLAAKEAPSSAAGDTEPPVDTSAPG